MASKSKTYDFGKNTIIAKSFSTTPGNANKAQTLNFQGFAVNAKGFLTSKGSLSKSDILDYQNYDILADSFSGSIALEPTYSNRYYFASVGMRFPNKFATITAGQSNYASQLNFKTAPWVIPAGTSVLLAYPNQTNIEGNETVNEQLIGSTATVTAASISYQDAGGTTRVAAATAFTNSGVLSSTVRDGGVIATIPLTYDIPASSAITIRTELQSTSGASLISFYRLRSGEVARIAPSGTTFTAAVNSGSAITVAGSTGSNINGYQYGPAFMCAKGIDGRSVPLIDGDSLSYGKGTLDDVATDRLAGMCEHGLARSSGTWGTAWGNFTIAGSGFTATDPTNGAYNVDIQKGRHALVTQVSALNGGYPPFNHIIEAHGTNSLQNTLAEHVRLIKTRYNWLLGMYPGMPITQVTMTQQVDSSSNGFQTVGGQTVLSGNQTTGVRFQFNDKLEADLVDSTVKFAVNTYASAAADSSSNRDKFKVHPFTGITTRITTDPATNTPAGTIELYVNNVTGLQVGSAVVIDPLGVDPQLYIVRTITTVTLGAEYLLTLFVGASSATFPIGKVIGTAVGGSYTADGDPNGSAGANTGGLGGVHRTAELDALTASYAGTNSWDAWKAAVKSATGWAG